MGREGAQSTLYNPVFESYMEEQRRAVACIQRVKYGDILLLLHWLDPWVNVDDAIPNFIDFYFYAGYDFTNKWASYLGDASRKSTMATRLREAFGITDKEIQFGREQLTTKVWNYEDVASTLEAFLLGASARAPVRLTELVSMSASKGCPKKHSEDTNPV